MLIDIEELALGYYDPLDRCAFWRISVPEDHEMSKKLTKLRRRALYDTDVDACVKYEGEVNLFYSLCATDKLLKSRIPVKSGDIVEVDIGSQTKSFIFSFNFISFGLNNPFGTSSNPINLIIWTEMNESLTPANYWGVYHHRVAFDHRPYKTEILANLTYSKEGLNTWFKIGNRRCVIKTKTTLADIEAYVKSFRKMIHGDKAPLFYTINKNEKWTIYTDLFI